MEVRGTLSCSRGRRHLLWYDSHNRRANLRSRTCSQWVIATEMIYNPASAAVKICILLLYHRIFPMHQFRIILWSVGCFITCCCVAMSFVVIFQCRPIRAAWDTKVEGHCINLVAPYVILGSFNALTDIIALCLPMPFLWRLHVDKVRKVQLIGTFSVGTL